MTLIVVIAVRDGIVLASDSRQTVLATLTPEVGPSKAIPQNVSFTESDSVSKIFLAPKNNVAIAHHHMADVNGTPLSEDIKAFISEKLSNDSIQIDEIPKMLLEYFEAQHIKTRAFFYVCGYKRGADGRLDQQVWHVDLQNEGINRSNKPDSYGPSYGGEADVIRRMIGPVGLLDKNGNVVEKFENWPIYWQDFTLQDAIDYATFVIRATIGLISFQIRQKTVGGPIDVLVIEPNNATWFQQKQLHV